MTLHWLIDTLGKILVRDLLGDLLADYVEGVDWVATTLAAWWEHLPRGFKRVALPVLCCLHSYKEPLARVVFRLDVAVRQRGGEGVGLSLPCPRCRCLADSRSSQGCCASCGHPL